MANYNESSINGTSYQRAWRVEAENPLEGSKHITFHEEVVAVLADDTIHKQKGNITKAYDPSASFNLLNPETGAVVGSMTHDELYAAIYSLYIATATERDATIQETP
jgi:hypothetical protein